MKIPLLRIQGLHTLALLFTLFLSVQTYGVAPVLDNIEPGILNYTEGDGAVLITSTITVKDIDDTLLQWATITIANFRSGEDVLSFTGIPGINYTWDNITGVLYLYGSANVAAYQTLLRTVTYENTSLAPTEVSRTVSFVVSDGILKSNTESRTIAVTSVNEAPVLTVISPAIISYTENDPAVRINNTINLADGDDTHMESATVAITSNYQKGQDSLIFTNPTGITGVFNEETGVITFTGHATIALYVTALRSVYYQNTSDNPSTPTRQISFSVNDGDDKSNTLTFSITVIAVNDVPILRNMETTTLPFTENSIAIAVTATLSVSDPDNANLASAEIKITGNYQSGEDTLLYSTLNDITGSWNKSTGALSLSGNATLAQYTAALRSVKYQNISEDPSILTRTVSFTANDGAGTSLAATRNIAVSAVNDAPVLSKLEVLPLAYTAGAGLKILTDSIQVADTDDVNLETATIRILGNYKTGQDYIRFTNSYGITGNWTAGTGTMTLNGPASVANFRSALRSVKYENTNIINPSTLARTITFRVNDGTANSNTLSRVVSFVPTATISGGDTICQYQKDSILIDLTGEPNWTVVIRRSGNSNPLLNKDTTISGITTSHYGFLTNITGTYVLLSVKDKNYEAGLVYGSAIILNYPLTTAKLTGTAQICQDGSSAPLTVDFTGSSPWTFGLRRNTQDTIYTGITQDPFIINVNKQGIYRITSLADQHCIGDTVAGYGTATLSYISSPKATISGSDTICQGDTATLNVLFEGTAPFSITYLVNGANAQTISNITQVDYALKVKAAGIYTLSAVTDQIRSGCVSGFGTVVFYPSPTAVIAGSTTICEHTSANLPVTLTGSAPWTFSYRRNTTDTTTVTGVAASPNFVSVNKAGAYSLLTVSDKLCKGTVSGSAVITVTPAPEVEITGLAPAYSKDTLMVPVFGNPEGGSFAPPVYFVRDTNFFFPNWAGVGMHAIIYSYRDPGTGCYGYDTVNVMVLAADADIMFPENDTKKLFCYNDSVFTVFGNNTVNDTGTFTISGGIGLVDNGDNSATIDPSMLNGGTYTVTYRYFNSTYLEIQETFELEKIVEIEIVGFNPTSYCQNANQIRLYGQPSGGIFDGNAVFGNTSSGFYFRSDLTGPGQDTVFYTLTGPKGCSRKVFKSLMIYDTPDILFAVNDTCIYTGIYDSTAFINLTACGDAIQSWYWNFDDIESGAKNSSTLKNPKHRYRDGGRRDILLRATSSQGCMGEDWITFNFGDKPLAAFSWETECFHAGQKIAFTNESSFSEGEIKEYLWKFTNGVSYDTYTTKDVDYQFGSPDEYEVELFVTTSYGCTDTILQAIHIRPTYTLQKGSTYYESFESGAAGWASGHDDMVPLNSWTLGEPVAFVGDGGGGVMAWYTDITSNQPDAEQSYVTSPCFSFDSIFKPMIKFAMYRLFNVNRDGAILQYSTNNWNTVTPLGKYEINGLDGIYWYNWVGIEGAPGGSVVGWSNVKDPGWIEARHSLDMLKGKKDVQFRMAYGSDGTAIGTEGMAFDNVWIGERNKMTLIEHFTSTGDEASLSADSQLDAMANASPLDIIDIQYHTSFAGIDPFNQQNQVDPRTRASLYQVSTVPVSILNGFTTSKYRFDYADNELDTNFIKIQSLADSKFSLDVQSTRLDNSLDMTVTIKPLEALAKHRVTLHIAVIERMVWGVTGANGDTMFESVLKTMLPDTSFTNDWDPVSGQTFTVERDWNFKNTYDAAELRVIAFLQDEDTREIYQSAISEYDLHTGTPGDNNPNFSNESTGFIVFPNPASTDVYIMFEEVLEKKARADLFDINGRLIMTRELFSGNTLYETALHDFPEGLYFLRITSDNQFVGLHKLIISR